MAGLSSKLSSLVEATDDPMIPLYAYTHLGMGVPNNPYDRGFRSRLEEARNQIFSHWYRSRGPLGQFQRLQKEMERERAERQKEMERELVRRMEEQQRELQETALLNAQEQQLTVQLFQQSSLRLVVRHLSAAKTEELRAQSANPHPLARLLVVQTIRARRLHLEPELIERLKDPDSVVRQAAHAALVRVARGTDFGPIPGASQQGIARSVEKWRHWLALQHGDLSRTTAVAGVAKEDKIDPVKAVKVVLGQPDRELQTVSSEATHLCEELVKAKGDEQMAVLARLRDSKGVDNTDALALAIPKLPLGAAQREARDALTQRLTRMTAATLRDKLQEDAVEVRRAAALACGRKKATEHIPDLLQLLDDPEVAVIQAARTALKELTGEDFGPDTEAGRRGRASAVAAWRQWWKEHPSEQK